MSIETRVEMTDGRTVYNSTGWQHEADYCRSVGLTVGDRLEGDEGYGVSVFWITAIGEELVLARTSHRGSPFGSECTVTFSCRDWRKVADDGRGVVEGTAG